MEALTFERWTLAHKHLILIAHAIPLKPSLERNAASVTLGSWTKPLARHWRLLRSFYLLI